jgi:hypothetical protein
MLLVHQVPICDARGFDPNGSTRLHVPDWELPTAGVEFVRCFGAMHRRLSGGHEHLPGEAFYCDASRAVRLDRLERQWIGRDPQQFKPFCAFRRLFTAGPTVARFELGISTATRSHETELTDTTGAQMMRMVLDLLDLPVRVVGFGSDPVNVPLCRVGPPLARLFASASAPTSAVGGDETPLVVAGEPFELVEYDASEVAELPGAARPVDPAAVNGAKLAFLWLEYRHRPYGVWFLSRSSLPADQARRLRLGLLRLHAEHQVLKSTLSLVARGKLCHAPGSAEGDALDRYLNDATRLLRRRAGDGIPQEALRDVMLAYEQVVDPHEQEVLFQRLEGVRRQVRLKVKGYAQRSTDLQATNPGSGPQLESGDAVNVFVSFSHRDAEYVGEGSLLGYLRGLEIDRFRFWYDGRIQAGDQWDDAIRTQIEHCDMALVLVSQRFLNSRYCNDIEIEAFLREHEVRGLVIVPVILSPCDWRRHSWLASTQFVPSGDRTIAVDGRDSGARDALFLEVLEELRAVGQSIRESRTARAHGGR